MPVKPETCSFEDMVQLLRKSPTGKLIDSFVRVEMGQDYLQAAWDAFKDIAEYFDEEYLGNKAMLNQFLITIEDDIRFSDMGLKLPL